MLQSDHMQSDGLGGTELATPNNRVMQSDCMMSDCMKPDDTALNLIRGEEKGALSLFADDEISRLPVYLEILKRGTW